MKYPMLVLCAVALTSTALAEDPSSTKSSGDLFTTVDRDADGKVTKEEAATNASFEKNFDGAGWKFGRRRDRARISKKHDAQVEMTENRAGRGETGFRRPRLE
jgi:hypothetical protein